jgi:hypothetical protein
MVDHDAHIGRVFFLWRGYVTHVEFGIGVDHLHLLAKLSHVKPHSRLDWWRRLHREDRSFLRLHEPQTHHVVGDVEF